MVGSSLSVWCPGDNRVSELWENLSPETKFSTEAEDCSLCKTPRDTFNCVRLRSFDFLTRNLQSFTQVSADLK